MDWADFSWGFGVGAYAIGVAGVAWATWATREPWPDRIAIIFGWPIAIVLNLCKG